MSEPDFPALRAARDEARNKIAAKIAAKYGMALVHFSGADGCYCACPDGPCEHEFDGWRDILDDEGRVSGGESVCRLCGMGAMTQPTDTPAASGETGAAEMREAAMRPCPFCGGKAELQEYDDGNGGNYAFVRCEACWAKGQEANYGQVGVAVKFWNRRFLPLPPDPNIDDDAENLCI